MKLQRVARNSFPPPTFLRQNGVINCVPVAIFLKASRFLFASKA